MRCCRLPVGPRRHVLLALCLRFRRPTHRFCRFNANELSGIMYVCTTLARTIKKKRGSLAGPKTIFRGYYCTSPTFLPYKGAPTSLFTNILYCLSTCRTRKPLGIRMVARHTEKLRFAVPVSEREVRLTSRQWCARHSHHTQEYQVSSGWSFR
jgi:hypothetical protein